ncbi:hypothetical protein D3C83_91000 [compost metagenome]
MDVDVDNDVERGVDATKDAARRGADAVKDGARKAGEAVEGAVDGDPDSNRDGK